MFSAPWLLPRNSQQRPARAKAGKVRRTTRPRVEQLEDRLALSGYSPPTTGLVAWWAADGTANDAVGGHNGTLVNGTYGPGILGTDQAFVLNGTSSSVQVPSDPAWNLGAHDFTIDLWVNYSALRADSLGQPQSVFMAHDEGGGNQSKWFFAYGGGDLYWHMNSPATGPVFLALAPFTPNVNQWYNLAISRSGSTFTIYVNGQPVASQDNAQPVPDANAPLTLGEAESPPGNFFMNGRMDDVLLYNRALSAQELAGLTNGQSTTTLTSSAASAVLGQPVTFTATVSAPLGTPTGSVDFVDTTTGADLGTVLLSANGKASVTVSNLSAGPHAIQAVYAGDGIVLGSKSNTVAEQVNYRFSGFLGELERQRVFPVGRNVRIQFRLRDYSGHYLSSLSNVQSLSVNDVTLYNGTTGASQDSAGGLGLHYNPATHEYVFDWTTKGFAPGSYTITLQLADGTSHSVTIQLRHGHDCGGARDHGHGHLGTLLDGGVDF
jgi:hypothetical protein